MDTKLIKFKRIYRCIPTALTLGNTMCGFTAIIITLQVFYPDAKEDAPTYLAISAWLIGGAMIFDMLDGWTARKLNATSPHGMEMDSLADMVTFGVAPAVIVAIMGHDAIQNRFAWLPWAWVIVACYVYVSCVALRLALYNVLAMEKTDDADGTSFHGLPSPGGAAAICSLIILYRSAVDLPIVARLVQILPFYAIVLGGLMVSSIPYVHIGKWLGGKKRNKVKIFLIILLALAFGKWPALVAAIGVNIYVFSGPVVAVGRWIFRSSGRPTKESA